MRKCRIKKIAACAMALVFSVVIFCLPAAAASNLVSFVGVKPEVKIYTEGVYQVDAEVSSSLQPNSQGNIYYSINPVYTSVWDEAVFEWRFDRVSLQSGRDYSFSFRFTNNPGENFFTDAYVSLLDGSSSSDERYFSVSNFSGYPGFQGTIDSSALAGLSGIDGFRIRFVNSYTFNQGIVFHGWLYTGLTYLQPGSTWADEIGDKIDNGFGQIIDGDGTPLPEQPDIDGEINDIESAENEALGGKSDEQIQQDVDNALDYDIDSIDQDAASAVSGFFDDLLTCFGSSYESVLLLSLTLGLASFIIGRRYA